ncbi:thiol reductant ABC exporter subunit CydC [Canibacter zhoujuaniae]|uniref:thiol reductant ABC exporter subunit CydC n=1 Tax=Canibacter zhoujuaniae TaxID=2708343 RepID=UPI0014219FFD|nr:thiol reductant ABC exporter subunit CydC [Canibacter zhoujuaniae]
MVKDLRAAAVPSFVARAPGVLLGVLADACVVGLLALSMWLIVRAAEQPPILYLNFAIVGVRAIAIGRAAFRYVERLASHDAAFAQLAVLRGVTFQRLLPRIPGGVETNRRGEVLAAFVDDVDQLQDEALRVRQPLIVSSVVVLLSLILVALISPLAALMTAVSIGGAAVIAVWLTDRIAGRSQSALSAARAKLQDAILERAEAAEVLAAFGATQNADAKVFAAAEQLSKIQRKQATTAGLTAGLMLLGAGLATVMILLFVQPNMGAGLFGLTVIVPAAIAEVFLAVPLALNARRRVQSSAARVARLTTSELPAELPQTAQDLEISDPDDSGEKRRSAAVTLRAQLPQGEPLIAASNLTIKHPGSGDPQIKDLSFELHAGETLLITGESGSGKSTLAAAMVRFLDYAGSLQIFGVAARDLGGPTVRQLIGLCEQQPHLFDTNLRQNLLFAKPSASDAELMLMLKRVGLHEWVTARGGLEMRIGNRGALVSGGQAQRIALARVLLAEFPIVVLDEPTASVDRDRADTLLQELVAAVPQDRALLLISHTVPPAVRARAAGEIVL